MPKEYIIHILHTLDKKADGKRNREFIYDKISGLTFQKYKTRSIIRDDDNNVLLTTINREQVENYYIMYLYKMHIL